MAALMQLLNYLFWYHIKLDLSTFELKLMFYHNGESKAKKINFKSIKHYYFGYVIVVAESIEIKI